MKHKVAGSLVSGGGIGDVGLEWGAGIPVIAAGEIIPSRAALIRKNFLIVVYLKEIYMISRMTILNIFKRTQGSNPWLLTLSPPCQGMSSNGAGRISAEIKAEKGPREDQRNRLILPGIEILEKLNPIGSSLRMLKEWRTPLSGMSVNSRRIFWIVYQDDCIIGVLDFCKYTRF